MSHVGVKILCSLMVVLLSVGYAQQYIIVGGGYHPLYSEASIENDVIQMIGAIGNKPKVVLYGSGNDASICDVSEKQRDLDPILSFVLGFEDYQNKLYQCVVRHNKIEGVNYSATSESLYKVLENEKSSGKKSSIKIYYAGHGTNGSVYDEESLSRYSDSQKERLNFDENVLSLWKEPNITVQEFSEKLDQFDKNRQIQLLMVQCYSGGFSQINYVKGDIWEYELSDHDRCGFFSQIPSRVAAGCTIDLEQNRGYSRYFFEAIKDKTADYDKDGKVSTPEAHAYVAINSESIDIPITTSSQLMHDYERLSKKVTISPELKAFSLVTFLEKMSFIERQTIGGLIKRLNIQDEQFKNTPYLFIEESIETLKEKKKELNEALEASQENLRLSISNAQRVVFEEYPYVYRRFLPNDDVALHNEYNQAMQELAERIKNNDEFLEELKKQNSTYDNANSLFLDKEREIVVWERLQYLIETVMIRDFLISPDSKFLVKYKELLACENNSFIN